MDDIWVSEAALVDKLGLIQMFSIENRFNVPQNVVVDQHRVRSTRGGEVLDAKEGIREGVEGPIEGREDSKNVIDPSLRIK